MGAEKDREQRDGERRSRVSQTEGESRESRESRREFEVGHLY